MSEVLIFSLAIDPVSKGRPRATVRGGFASVYTDAKTRKYERDIGMMAMSAMRGQEPFQGPISVSMRFRLALPKSLSKRARAAILAGENAYLGIRDLDNLGKSVGDALNGICWRDDVQIVRLFLSKIPAETGGVDVRISSLSSPGARGDPG